MESVNTHLLSIFPLKNEAEYARVTLTEVEDSLLPKPAAFRATREVVFAVLSTCVARVEAERLLAMLDDGDVIQLSITAEQAFTASLCRTRLHQ